ncbi:conserved hypothetical protein [uncultured delta proteobacterium]|uniref:Uncharacterized protein n=1 Tax=uncultured delta proteobacterium TaxID=34034 RepID=A0A212JHX2_9DELT|nr:conserved hypothetical protein [uncultured delta proteobacterium]
MADLPKIDVLINVFGKPYQTMLALLSLLRHSGQHIGTVYFQEEPCTAEFERRDHSQILRLLGDRAVQYQAKHWCGISTTDVSRLTEEDYRLSMRYQYGWENAKQPYVLLIHNDIEVTGDIAGALLGAIGEATGAGQIGQCWWCPAFEAGACSPERYTAFKPKYHQLMYMYNTGMDYTKRRAYNLGLNQSFWDNPWPLPECRLNEWCALIDLKKARPATMPYGNAAPIGAKYPSGSKIGENWDRDVNLDTAVQWFRDMSLAGHTFTHYPIEQYVIHDRLGCTKLDSAEKYVQAEMAAKLRLAEDYPDALRA